MPISYLDCHEAGLCCYLAIRIKNLLRLFELFRPILWDILKCSFGYFFNSSLGIKICSGILDTSLHDVLPSIGHAVTQAVSRQLPTVAARVCFWTGIWGRLSPSASVSPASHHSTNLSIIIITRGWHNRPIGDHFDIVGGGVQLGPLGPAATNRPIVPGPGDYDDREIDGMVSKGNRSTRRKPAPLTLCPPQNPHAARTRTRAAAVGSQRLTA
jgi:hypothetical protein